MSLLLTLLALGFLTLAHALPNVTAIPLSPGTCTGFPSGFPGASDSADSFLFVPTQVDNPAINNLPTYITGNTLVVALQNTTTADIFCCDHGGAVLSALGDKILLFPTQSPTNMNQMMTLESMAYTSYATGVTGPESSGSKPLAYSHVLNGVKQNGVFLGRDNFTTWAFGRLADDRSWRVRLMTAEAEELQSGEVLGFLSIVGL